MVGDLLTRPILVEMVLSSLDTLRSERLTYVDTGTLYDSYVSQWIDRDVGRSTNRMTPDGKRLFMEYLALILTESPHSEGAVHFSALTDYVGVF